MTWPTVDPSERVDVGAIGSLVPEEILYDFDGPCIYTARTPAKSLVLAYLSEDLEEEQRLRYVVATTSGTTIEELKRGVISVRQALTRGSMWVVDLDYGRHPVEAFAATEDLLPTDALPAPTTMLWAKLEPALRLKLEGAAVEPGRLPPAVFQHAAEVAARALKPLIEHAARRLRSDTTGRPPDWLRNLYALPTQRLCFGSLEVSYLNPEIPVSAQGSLPLNVVEATPSPQAIVEEGWRLLRLGLNWAASGADELADVSDDERLPVLEALGRLAPSASGPVERVGVSGQMIDRGNQPRVLDREASKRIRRQLARYRKSQGVQLRMFRGRVRDLDLDKLTFVLRDDPQVPSDISCVLEDELFFDLVREAHYQELPVIIAGRSIDGRVWTVAEAEYAHPGTPPASES